MSDSDPEEQAVQQGFEFDFGNRPQICQLFGKCNSGKSEMIRALIYATCARPDPVYKWIIVFTATTFNQFYTQFLPSHCVRKFSPEAFFDVFRKIEAKVTRGGQKKGFKLDHGLVVLDDCQGLWAKVKHTPEFNSIQISHRHRGVSLWYSNQYVVGMTTLQRSLCDLAVLFRASDEPSLKHLYRMAGTMFPNFKTFKAEFLRATAPTHTALVFKNGHDTIAESYSTFKCDLAPKFVLRMKPNGL